MKKVSLILGSILITTMLISYSGCVSSRVFSRSNNLPKSNEVTIGNQVWMTKNLNVDKFRNGEPIPQAKTDEEWKKAGDNGEPAWCYYDNDPANGEKYGKLYNWYAVNDPRGLAPEGWHIPSDEEWRALTDYLGFEAGTKMKSTSGWKDDGNGTNESGFSGLPVGIRSGISDFFSMGDLGSWWSSTEYDDGTAQFFYLIYFDILNYRIQIYDKSRGLSVRCVKYY